MISILLAIRKNSKMFPKFLVSYLKHTKTDEVELLVLANHEDTWNQDYFDHFKITAFREDYNAGAKARHLFYNDLAKQAKGDWLWHMCDDHYLLDGYDRYLLDYIKDNHIDSNKIEVIVPRVDNSGSVSHLLSRGYYNATGRIGYHGNIDSYLNCVHERMFKPDRLHYPTQPVLHDFTPDQFIHEKGHTVCVGPQTEAHHFYDFMHENVQKEINKDALVLYNAIMEGK